MPSLIHTLTISKSNSLMDFQGRSLANALDGLRDGIASEYVALPRGARFQGATRKDERAPVLRLPAAARAGNLFTRAIARIWGRS